MSIRIKSLDVRFKKYSRAKLLSVSGLMFIERSYRLSLFEKQYEESFSEGFKITLLWIDFVFVVIESLPCLYSCCVLPVEKVVLVFVIVFGSVFFIGRNRTKRTDKTMAMIVI